MNTKILIKIQNYCVTCETMQTKIRNCCTNTNRVTAIYNCSSVTSSIITTMNKRRLKNNMCNMCNMCNNTIKITLNCITTRKSAKEIKNIINAVDEQELANNNDRQFQGPTKFRSTFVMLKLKL